MDFYGVTSADMDGIIIVAGNEDYGGRGVCDFHMQDGLPQYKVSLRSTNDLDVVRSRVFRRRRPR